jgi:hypothetical protein
VPDLTIPTMSLLEAHLEQISFSSQGIDSLPYVPILLFPPRPKTTNKLPSFPPPKIFTNALLSNHDITSLIRDTEAHERALFSVPPPPPPQIVVPPKKEAASDPAAKPSAKRRQTVFNVAAGEVTTGPPSSTTRRPRQHTAVAAVLGGDLHAQIAGRRGKAEDGAIKGDVDVEVLLRGAEKLCTVYPQPRAMDRIPALRQEYAHQNDTEAYYEARVAGQSEALGRMNKDHLFDYDDEEDDEEEAYQGDVWTDEELRREDGEVRELERKKRALQDRLRDLNEDARGLDKSEPRWS